MKTGRLLEELIDISQTTKTDFAISMNMSPSGLSKILKGGRLPLLKEKGEFSKQAAAYFADALYGHCCYLKLIHIFPVIYDFNSRYELERFLSYALEYAIDEDFDEDNNGNLSFCNRNSSFMGNKVILNMFCMFVSNYIMDGSDVPLEFYSNIPFFDRAYSDIFPRIKISNSRNQVRAVFNYFLNNTAIELSISEYSIDLFYSIVKAQEHVDLNFWKITKEMNCSFLFLKGKFILLFSLPLDRVSLMTLVTDIGYLNIFSDALAKMEAKKISYSGREAAAALELDPSIPNWIMDKHVDVVYNFIPIGYLVGEKDLKSAEGMEVSKRTILEFFHRVMDGETIFFMALNAMHEFCALGKAIVPLFGAIDFSPKERIQYLQKFNALINDKSFDKIRALDGEQPKAAVICLQGLNVIYMIDQDYKNEKIHYFETNLFQDIIERQITKYAMKVTEFSPELWQAYISDVTKKLERIGL
ncbi:hypothetical protein [Lacrimispora sp.]|uniref:hypothetical protein n=1 Tax=Lacrimispora sp. TaxID=2719234 RepID=UPI00289B46EA|nr:hypothetical protein [Lacrimispora sp.]